MFKSFLRKILKYTVERFIVRIIRETDSVIGHENLYRHHRMHLSTVLAERAVQSSADFVEPLLPNVLVFISRYNLWDYAIQKITETHGMKGTALEFGTGGGNSANYMSEKLPGFTFYGFDSLLGLAEDWKGFMLPKGHFSRDGVAPELNSNVTLVTGFFKDTLPKFVQNTDLSGLALVHIDCDTYESTMTVFENIAQHLQPDVFIIFDELMGYSNWQNGEFKALNEAAEKFNFEFEYLAFTGQRALIRITAA